MAYDPANPPHVIAELIAGQSLWHYKSADAVSAVVVPGYFTDAVARGMKVNDAVLCTTLTGDEGALNVLVVLRLNANGSADVTYTEGSADTLRADLASAAAAKGASLVALTQGGTVQDAIKFFTPEMYGATGDGATVETTAVQSAINAASTLGESLNSVVDVVLASGRVYVVDVSIASSTTPCVKLKNYVRLTGPGTIKAKNASYSTGNPAIIGNDQAGAGTTEIYVDGITVDANGANNVISTAGAIGVLFGRPIGPSGGPGAVGVVNGAIRNVKIVDNSFIGVQVKNGSSNIKIENITNSGGSYAVQAANSTMIDIDTVFSTDTTNNAVDIYGNNGEKWAIGTKAGTFAVGDTITETLTGFTGRVLQDNGDGTIQVDTISSAFTPGNAVTTTSGGSGTFTSKTFTKGNFSGSVRGVHADGCLTGVFLESVADVPVSDCVIKNAAGNGCIINRINSITSGNRVTNFNVVNAAAAGLLYNGEVTDNICEISVDGAVDGVRFNGSSYNSAANCKISNVTNGYKLTGTGSKNRISGGSINVATTGVDVAATQSSWTVDKPEFIGVTTRLVDAASASASTGRFVHPEDGRVVDVSGAANITPNLHAGTEFWTSTAISTPIAINAPSGQYRRGQRAAVLLKQDGTGGFAVTFNAIYKVKTAVATGANRRSHYQFVWTGTFFESVSEVIDF